MTKCESQAVLTCSGPFSALSIPVILAAFELPLTTIPNTLLLSQFARGGLISSD